MPAIARADAVVLCFGACLFALIVYLPLYLQLGRGLGIGASGVLLLPITLAQVTSAAITGRLVTRTGHVTIFPKIGLSVVCLVFVALSLSVDRASTLVILGLTVLAGIGLGMVMPPTQVAVQTAAGRGALGVATGSISLCRAVGGATGVAVVGAVLFALIDRAGGAATALLHQAMEGGSAFIATLSEVAAREPRRLRQRRVSRRVCGARGICGRRRADRRHGTAIPMARRRDRVGRALMRDYFLRAVRRAGRGVLRDAKPSA